MKPQVPYLFLVLFACLQGIFAQEITIPFRDGAKWGFCNLEGKMLVEPQFDGYDFKDSDNSSLEYMITKKGLLMGLVSGGKEILAPIYTEIYEYNKLLTIKTAENGGFEDRISIEGKSIFDKKYAKISSTGRIGSTYFLYILLNFDGTEDVLAFDSKTQKIIQKLYQNVYSVTRLPKQFDESQYVLLIQKTEKSPIVEESWNLTKAPFTKNTTGLRYMTENEFLQYFSKNSYQNNERSSWGSESMGSDMSDVVVPSRGDYLRSGVLAEGDADSRGKLGDALNVTTKTYQFVREQESIILLIVTDNQIEKKEKITIQLSVPVKDIKMQTRMFTAKNNTVSKTFYNYIEYTKNGKIGLIFANDFKNPAEFDYVDSNSIRTTNDSYNGAEIIFKVGKKDKNNKMKYGFYSNFRKQIVDFIYDDLEITSFSTPQQNRVYIAQKDSKFGIIQSDGTIVIAVEQEKFKNIEQKGSSGFCYQYNKGTQYGLVFVRNKEIVKTEAIFNHPIRKMIQNYPSFQRPRYEDTSKNSVSLLELVDEKGNFLGFANLNGTQYFKN